MNRSLVLLLAATGLVFAQTSPRPAAGAGPAIGLPPSPTTPDPGRRLRNPLTAPTLRGSRSRRPNRGRSSRPRRTGRPMDFPPEVTLRPGTYVTVRIDQPLSSDRQPARRHLRRPASRSRSSSMASSSRIGTNWFTGGLPKRRATPARMPLAPRARVDQHDPGRRHAGPDPLADWSGAGAGRRPADEQVGTVGDDHRDRRRRSARVAGLGTRRRDRRGRRRDGRNRRRADDAESPDRRLPGNALTFAIVERRSRSRPRNAPQAFRYVGPEDYNQAPPNAELQRTSGAGRRMPPYPATRIRTPYPYYGGYPYSAAASDRRRPELRLWRLWLRYGGYYRHDGVY